MNSLKNILQGILAITVYFILYFCSSFIIGLLPIDINSLSTNGKTLLSLLYELMIVIIIILIFFSTIKKDFNLYKKNIKLYLKTYIKYWLYALFFMYISNVIIMIFTKDIAQNEQSIRTLFKNSPIITFILAAFLAPILEELIFRLSLYKILGKYKWIFIIVSGLIFGSMHVIGNSSTLGEWLYIIPYGIPGCFFAYTLVKSDNIFVPMSLHCIHNTSALLLQVIAFFLK